MTRMRGIDALMSKAVAKQSPRVGVVVSVDGMSAKVDVGGSTVDASLTDQTVTACSPGVAVTLRPVGDTLQVTATYTGSDSSGSPQGPELLPNPDFEFGSAGSYPTSWRPAWNYTTGEPDPLTWDDTPGATLTAPGRALVQVRAGSWAHSTVVQPERAQQVDGGVAYIAAVWVAVNVTGSTDKVRLIVTSAQTESAAAYLGVDATTQTVAEVEDAGSAYQRISGQVTIPSSHRWARVGLWSEAGVGESGTVSWDSASLRQLVGVGSAGAPSSTPPYAGVRRGPWDAKEGLYNLTASSMTPGRLKIVGAKGGRNSTILICGSSTVSGYGSSGVGSWPIRLRDELERDGMPIRSEGPSFVGSAKALADGGEPDARWSFSGTVTQAAVALWATVANGAWAQFASVETGTDIQIHYFNDVVSSFTYSIDGGGAVTVNTTATATQSVVTIAGLANTTHTVKITGNHATPAQLIAVDVYKSGSTGLRIVQAGVGGTTSGNWTSISLKANLGVARAVSVPALTLISVGGNDCALGVSLSQFRSNIKAIVAWSKLGSSGLGLVAMPHAQAFTIAQWQPYVAALYDVADEDNVPLLDMTYRWTDLSTATNAGLFDGFVHPNSKGHADYAHAARRLVY